MTNPEELEDKRRLAELIDKRDYISEKYHSIYWIDLDSIDEGDYRHLEEELVKANSDIAAHMIEYKMDTAIDDCFDTGDIYNLNQHDVGDLLRYVMKKEESMLEVHDHI